MPISLYVQTGEENLYNSPISIPLGLLPILWATLSSFPILDWKVSLYFPELLQVIPSWKFSAFTSPIQGGGGFENQELIDNHSSVYIKIWEQGTNKFYMRQSSTRQLVLNLRVNKLFYWYRFPCFVGDSSTRVVCHFLCNVNQFFRRENKIFFCYITFPPIWQILPV